MSNLSQFIGGSRPPKTLVNGFHAGTAYAILSSNPGEKIASGALSAGVLKTVLSVAGAGAVQLLYARVVDTTSRTLRLRVTIDGTYVFDATTATLTSNNAGMTAIGYLPASGSEIVTFDSVTFNTSIVVEVASSLSETDKIVTHIIYETR